MVYCGKPSKGCSICRERKVRCDQQEPSCGQCQKRGHECPGYRNLVDLMFRDESNHVIKKANNTRSRAYKAISQSVHKSGAAPMVAIAQPNASINGMGEGSQAPACASPTAAHLLLRSQQQRPVPSPTSSSPRSTASLRISHEPEHGEERHRCQQDGRQRPGTHGHSPLLGILTPRSERISSAHSEDNASDEEAEPSGNCQLIFNYYDPELETCLPQLTHAEDEETDSTDDGEERRKPSDSILAYSLSPSLCERGTAFFFSRYVAIEATCHQGFDFIYEVWKPPATHFAGSVDGVTASMVAVGLSGLSKLTGSREAHIQAQHSYGIALNLTNAALRDPSKSATDSTMLAVLILGIYEFMAGRSPQTMSAWQKHVTGAAALASMRGTDQFSTNAGIRMFLMLCHSVLVNCIQSGLPMPESMVELRIELVRQDESQRPSWRLAEPVYRALQTRYDINCGVITDLDEIVERLNQIDEEFAALLSTLPESWAYRAVELDQENPAVYGRRCHIYGGLQQVTLWNGLRTVRMLLHETILEQLYTYVATFPSVQSIPEHYQQLLVKTMAILEMLGDAILASVPQHFGVVSARSLRPSPSGRGASPLPGGGETIRSMLSKARTGSTKPANAHNAAQSLPLTVSGPTLFEPIKAAGKEGIAEKFMTLASTSNTILWPLYVLGMSSSCSTEKHEYILDRIDAIYRETKLEQAQIIGRLLESRSDSGAWEHLRLGGVPSLPQGMLSEAL